MKSLKIAARPVESIRATDWLEDMKIIFAAAELLFIGTGGCG
jgi:hypothetical protein